MELFANVLLLLTAVILIVSLAYIIINTRHKEKMAMLEKGFNPSEQNDDPFPNPLKIGMFLMGIGLGFLAAFFLDEFIITTNENPAIYPGMIFVFGGLSQVLFYRISQKKKEL